MSAVRIVTFAQQPMTAALEEQVSALIQSVWQPIALIDNASNPIWDRLYSDFAAFQFQGYDDSDRLILVGNSIPVLWDQPFAMLPDAGWDWAMLNGFECLETGASPNLLSALSVTIAADHQGTGLSRIAILKMKEIAAAHRLTALIAPVRPNHKPKYPLTPMEHYITWKREDGAPFDPWIRTHWRLGAQIVKVCSHSMRAQYPVAEFEAEVGMAFPESGDYLAPGSLNPLHVDREADQAVYIEPNVWVAHNL